MSARVTFLGIGSLGSLGTRVDAVFAARRPCSDCHVDGVRLIGSCGCDDGVVVVEVFVDELDADEVAWLRASGDVNALAAWERWGSDDVAAPSEEGWAA